MSKWAQVGDWLKDNAGSGAALVGSLLTGNVAGAVAAGASLVATATGSDDPSKVMAALKSDPATVVRLQELANANEDSIRRHLEVMEAQKLQDQQEEHKQTQETVRSSDNSHDAFVRRTRPGQSWLSLLAAIGYVFYSPTPDLWILGALLTLPLSYAGLRQIGKGVGLFGAMASSRKSK